MNFDKAKWTALAGACLLTLAGCGGGGDTGPAGSAGAQGLPSLTALAAETAGASCTAGGTKISAGSDSNLNGLLDSSEVTYTSYACNGAAGLAGETSAAGLSSLMAVTAEPAGANCASGGSKITSGLDANSDRVLGASEISNTVYACNGGTGATGATGATGVAGAVLVLLVLLVQQVPQGLQVLQALQGLQVRQAPREYRAPPD